MNVDAPTIAEGEYAIQPKNLQLATVGLQTCVGLVVVGEDCNAIGHFSSPRGASQGASKIISNLIERGENLQNLQFYIVHLDANPCPTFLGGSRENIRGVLHGLSKHEIEKSKVQLITQPQIIGDDEFGVVCLKQNTNVPEVSICDGSEVLAFLTSLPEGRMKNYRALKDATDTTAVDRAGLTLDQVQRFTALETLMPPSALPSATTIAVGAVAIAATIAAAHNGGCNIS